jgi:hypothetical protein
MSSSYWQLLSDSPEHRAKADSTQLNGFLERGTLSRTTNDTISAFSLLAEPPRADGRRACARGANHHTFETDLTHPTTGTFQL